MYAYGPGSYAKLTGEFIITGKEVIDPPPGQKLDRLGLFLEGESAKRTYEAMKVKPTNDDVCEEGMRSKQRADWSASVTRMGPIAAAWRPSESVGIGGQEQCSPCLDAVD